MLFIIATIDSNSLLESTPQVFAVDIEALVKPILKGPPFTVQCVPVLQRFCRQQPPRVMVKLVTINPHEEFNLLADLELEAPTGLNSIPYIVLHLLTTQTWHFVVLKQILLLVTSSLPYCAQKYFGVIVIQKLNCEHQNLCSKVNCFHFKSRFSFEMIILLPVIYFIRSS